MAAVQLPAPTSPPAFAHGHDPDRGPGFRFPSVWFVFPSAAILSAPLLYLSLLAPKFQEIFRDFGVALPDYTVLALRLGGMIAHPAAWVGVVLAMIGLSVVTGNLIAGRHRAVFTWFAVILILGFIMVIAFRQAMLGPLNALIAALNAGQPQAAPAAQMPPKPGG